MNTAKQLTLLKSGLSVFALSLTFLAAPLAAQTANNTNAYNTNTNTTATRVVERDDDTDWGWAGLLGLLGLAGLMKKPNREVVVQRDVDSNVRRT